jgi:hypothetical protein
MNIFGGYQNQVMGGNWAWGGAYANSSVGGSFNFGSMWGMAYGMGNQGFGYGCRPCGFGGLSAGGATSAFLGGGFQFSRTPVYQTVAHQQALMETYTEQQKKTTKGTGKMWDVWFDSKDGQKTKRLSPLVLDLNGDGKAGITGKNIKGDGKISGKAVKFDLDPSRSVWSHKSRRRRPGKGAPRVDGARWEGKKYVDRNGKVLGEMRGQFYHWGKKTSKEKTEWLAKNSGDGLLVWDRNKDGKITSSKELFGNFDIKGKKKFKNGYEKLAHYFDKNKDGKVDGKELRGLKVWVDKNGDGKTQKGELQSLKKHNITSLNTKFKSKDMSSTFGTTKETTENVTKERVAGYETTLEHIFAGWRDDFSFFFFGGGARSGCGCC